MAYRMWLFALDLELPAANFHFQNIGGIRSILVYCLTQTKIGAVAVWLELPFNVLLMQIANAHTSSLLHYATLNHCYIQCASNLLNLLNWTLLHLRLNAWFSLYSL